MGDRTDSFHVDMQQYIAVTTIGPSTLRNQGASGVIEATQRFLSKLPICTFAVKEERSFLAILDTTTDELKGTLPPGARQWGAARKALNLFLRDVCYNRFLSPRYSLTEIERWLEIPLDSLVAGALKKHDEKGTLPSWPGLKGLKPEVGLQFQRVARHWADAEGISRVHLDMRIWVEQRTKSANTAVRPDD